MAAMANFAVAQIALKGSYRHIGFAPVSWTL